METQEREVWELQRKDAPQDARDALRPLFGSAAMSEPTTLKMVFRELGMCSEAVERVLVEVAPLNERLQQWQENIRGQLEEAAQELAVREQRLAGAEAAVQSRLDDVAQREKAVTGADVKEVELQRRAAQLDDREARLQALSAAVERRSDQLRAVELDLEVRSASLEAMEESIAARSEDLARREAAVGEVGEAVARLAERLRNL